MSTPLCKISVLRIYQDIIEDVIAGVRELFLEDGVDEQVLQELKQTWETKLMGSKAVQNEQDEKFKKQEHSASNGYPKIINNPVQGTVPQPQQQTQQLTPQIQQIVETKQVPIQITLPPQPGTDGTQRVLTIQVPASALQGNQLQKVLTGPVITATMGLPANIASSLLQQHVNAALSSQQVSAPQIVKTVSQTDGACDEDECGTSSSHCGQKIQSYASSSKFENILTQTDEMNGECDENMITIERSKPRVKDSKKIRRQLRTDVLVPQADGPGDTSDEEDGESDASGGDASDPDASDEKDADDEEMEDEGGEEEPLNSEDDVTDDDPSDLFDTDNIVVCQYDKIIRNRNKWKFYLKDGIMNLNGQDYVFQKATGDAEW